MGWRSRGFLASVVMTGTGPFMSRTFVLLACSLFIDELPERLKLHGI